MSRVAVMVLASALFAACAIGEPMSTDAGDGAAGRDATRADGGLDAGPMRCTRSSECIGDPRAAVCDTMRGHCTQCTASEDRCDPADHCDIPSGTCAPGCRSNDGCALPTPHCDTRLHACAECLLGEQCPIGTHCNAGRCTVTVCPMGFADCNRNMADACEVNLTTDAMNCGACGARPSETCNGRDDNCNGQCDEIAGCRVGVHRSIGVEHFYTTNRAEASCCGMTVERYDFFFLYAAATPGTVPFYRCYDSARGRHVYTARTDCNGAGTPEGTMGFIGTSGACGATPLYRMHRAANDDTFYTVSVAERDNAITLEYVALELAGYVWLAGGG